MYDSYKRHINYVRISVTDRCNLRCTYCMPEDGAPCMPQKDILSFTEITEFVKAVSLLGVTKVRLTGGEPLVRKNICSLVEMLSAIPTITDLAMTTNGVLLKKYAIGLKEAGLHRLNVSLDTLNPAKYSEITRGGNINHVFEGIDEARKAGFTSIKINAVRFVNTEPEEERALKDFCERENLELRFIHQMNLKEGQFSTIESNDGSMAGNCKLCNRIRLTANGMVKPCLFSDIEYSIKEHGIEKAVFYTVKNKPECGSASNTHEFYNIGG